MIGPHDALYLVGGLEGIDAFDKLVGGLRPTRARWRGIEADDARAVLSRRLETYRRLVRVFHEIRFLGMHPSDHPMRVLREEAARAGCVTSAQIESALGRTVTFAGIVSAQRRLAVRAGVVQFVTFEDEEGMLEAVLPPHSYARLGDPIRNPGPFLLTGRVEGESGDARLMIARALPFHSRPRPYATQSAS